MRDDELQKLTKECEELQDQLDRLQAQLKEIGNRIDSILRP